MIGRKKTSFPELGSSLTHRRGLSLTRFMSSSSSSSSSSASFPAPGNVNDLLVATGLQAEYFRCRIAWRGFVLHLRIGITFKYDGTGFKLLSTCAVEHVCRCKPEDEQRLLAYQWTTIERKEDLPGNPFGKLRNAKH